jgi:hypothetical protein
MAAAATRPHIPATQPVLPSSSTFTLGRVSLRLPYAVLTALPLYLWFAMSLFDLDLFKNVFRSS